MHLSHSLRARCPHRLLFLLTVSRASAATDRKRGHLVTSTLNPAVCSRPPAFLPVPGAPPVQLCPAGWELPGACAFPHPSPTSPLPLPHPLPQEGGCGRPARPPSGCFPGLVPGTCQPSSASVPGFSGCWERTAPRPDDPFLSQEPALADGGLGGARRGSACSSRAVRHFVCLCA